MTAFSYMLFGTALGICGLAWHDAGLRAVAFPAEDQDQIRACLFKYAPGAVETDAPPDEIARIAEDIVALLVGEKRDLTYADLDMTGLSAFDREVYGLTVKIEPGETTTYGDIARALGDIALSQRVGQSLGRNPFPIIVPCHRVLGAGGAMTGFSAPGGAEAKRRILKIEGALAAELFD